MKRTSCSAVILATLTMLVGVLAGLDRTFAADDRKAFRMIVGEPRFMDPNLATDYSIYVNAQLFEPLARIDNKGILTLLEAKSIEVGADKRTWTITLDPNYKWSNGQPITAADWEYSWKRILDPKLFKRGCRHSSSMSRTPTTTTRARSPTSARSASRRQANIRCKS